MTVNEVRHIAGFVLTEVTLVDQTGKNRTRISCYSNQQNGREPAF
jgi:hypothetical protein